MEMLSIKEFPGPERSQFIISVYGPEVHFSGQILSNTENKHWFNNILGDRLKRVGFAVEHARRDADIVIVMTAVKTCETNDTVLVGGDIDLLVLLCFSKNGKFLPVKTDLSPAGDCKGN